MLKRPEEEKRKWLEGVKKELNDFNKRGVWKVKKIKDIPEGRKMAAEKMGANPDRIAG